MQGLVIKVPAMKEPILIVEDDERPTEGPHPTDAGMRKCSVCGFTRRDAPSALMVCCGQPMEREAVGMAKGQRLQLTEPMPSTNVRFGSLTDIQRHTYLGPL